MLVCNEFHLETFGILKYMNPGSIFYRQSRAWPGRVAQPVARMTQEPDVLTWIPGSAFVSPSADSRLRAVVYYWRKHVHLVMATD